jgi:hypothetical protein
VLTWREAAVQALKGAGSLSVAAITSRVELLGLRPLTGATPEATVGAQLYSAVQSGDPRIRLVGPGLFEHTGSVAVERTRGVMGRLEFVSPRDVWVDEARDFTPWLLENADYLAEVLGIDLDLDEREHGIGSFSLDLLGRDHTHGCALIVENQLEETDHRHLGQLLTYAAGTDAMTVVWVAPRFRDEHRQALEYLNHISSGEARFFGVEVRVGVIGDSDPAPIFAVVAQPSDWRAQVKAQKVADALSPTKAAYLQFWTAYLERLHDSHPGFTKVRSPQPGNWMTLNFLRRGVGLNGVFPNGRLGCEIYIDAGNADANVAIFAALRQQRESIEHELVPNSTGRNSRVVGRAGFVSIDQVRPRMSRCTTT